MGTTEAAPVRVLTELPPLNIPLLRDIVMWAGKDKAAIDKSFHGWGEWEQESWAKEIRNGICKSSYCIAGQAVVQEGYVLHMEGGSRMSDGTTHWSADNCGPAIDTGKRDSKGRPIYEADTSNLRSIEVVAEQALGLEDDETVLFNGDNDFETVVSLASYFARRRGASMDFPESVAAFDKNISDAEFEHFQCHEGFGSCFSCDDD